MPISNTDLVPSAKYVAVFDNNGVAKVLQRPNNKCLLAFDGDSLYWIDGGDALPLNFNSMTVNQGQMTHILGVLGNGRVYRWVAPNDKKRVLTAQGGIVSWDEQSIIGVPASGFGILKREKYDAPPVPNPDFLNDPGLVYLDQNGSPGSIQDGANGQQLTMVDGVPTWSSASTGSVSSGAASVGLSGVVAGNTGANVVNVRCPSITVANSAGTEVKVSGVNVSADLGAALGAGGLDIGAENPSTWYYFYVISDGLGSVGGVISQSPTAPDTTNLGASTYYALASVFRNGSDSNIVTYQQRGRDFYLRPVQVADVVSISTAYSAMPVSQPLNSILPPSVKTVSGETGGSPTGATVALRETLNVMTLVAADTNGLAEQAVSTVSFAAATSFNGFQISFGNFYRIPVLDPSSPVIYWKGNVASAKRKVAITGYSI